MKYFALSSERCSTYVKNECEKLGFNNVIQTRGGVFFDGDFKDGENFCLHSFFSTRLLLEIEKKEGINSADDLYNFAKTIEWEKWILSSEKTFLITSNSENTPWCKNTASVALKVKDAITDRQREVYQDRSSINKENPDIIFHLFLEGSTASLYVDFSSRSLSKRHYRVKNTPIYLQENIASALLAFSPFVTLLEKGKLISVVDPFVGSGTILIEAALLASSSLPGLIDSTRFAFQNLPMFDKNEWEEVLNIAKEEDKKGKENFKKQIGNSIPFIGYDTDEKMLSAARENAKAANVLEFIKFENKDATLLEKEDIPKDASIITDPPYGRRIESENLKPLYYKFAKNLENIIDGGSLTLITGDNELTKVIPYDDKRVFSLLNGAVKCDIINKRFISAEERKAIEKKKNEEREKRLNSPLRPGALSLFNTLLKRKKEFDDYFSKHDISCYRLYDGGIMPFNAAIDVFENHFAVISEYSFNTNDDNESDKKIDTKIDELKNVIERLGIANEENIFVKTRKKMLGRTQYEKNANKDDKFVVHEHKLNFLVNFTNYIDNGIFLDSRLLREKILKTSRDKRFLNLFSYTGTATVHAAKGGALSTVSVDSSNTYLNWAKDNMRINNFDTMNHFYYNEDAMEFLKKLDRRTKFDLVFLDPPTFSNSHSRNSFDVQKDHEFMIMLIMNHLEKGGTLIFCTNFRDFKMSPRTLEHYNVKETSAETIDIDFKDRKYPIHKSFEIKHKIKHYV